jgi:hypothetical protein
LSFFFVFFWSSHLTGLSSFFFNSVILRFLLSFLSFLVLLIQHFEHKEK